MTVRVEQRGAVTLVTIDRPERANALDGATMGGLGSAFAAAEADDSVRVVVLTGAGDRVFCAGMDLKAQGEERVPPPGTPGLEVFMNRCYPKPVIAAVNGTAMGGGFELVMASDMAVAADHVMFGVPEVKRGIVGAGCSTRTAARVPPAIAYEMTLTGDPIDARRALELGLVNEVVARDEPLDRAMELAARVAVNAPIALRITKQIVWEEARNHDAEEWAAIRAKAAPAFASNDAREGAAAFAERREPVWTGT
ncbi:MAG TPA: enoyl-CoA hydratase-related protein [Acidimicrobiia bacterium]|nr:enoyl-CoA hydratase-related protein [Acidimicrobiia bacterium]